MLNGEVIDKAHSDDDVRQSLQQLSGQTHEVHTHVVIQTSTQRLEATSINQLVMRPLSEEGINHYVQSAKALVGRWLCYQFLKALASSSIYPRL